MQHWAEAIKANQASIEAGRFLLDTAYTEVGRQAEVREISQLYAQTAYCQLKLGQYDMALITLDNSKAQLMAQALALDENNLIRLPSDQQEIIHQHRERIRELEAEIKLPQSTSSRRNDQELSRMLREARQTLQRSIEAVRQKHSEFMLTQLSLVELLKLIPDGGALIAPVMTPQGSAVLVVPQGSESLTESHVVWLDDTTDGTVLEWLIGIEKKQGWLQSYRNRQTDEKTWHFTITDTLTNLLDTIITAVINKLGVLDIKPGASLLLMPQRGLGLFPLHALLLDQYPVIIAPSGYALQTSQRRLARQSVELILKAVINPTQDLPFTPAEGKAIINYFDQHSVTILQEAQASQAAVQASLSTPTDSSVIFHFSGHGYYDWDDPLQSRLILSDGQLTLNDLMGVSTLENTRLVVLSACETGITDISQTPDEFLGLPAGFLQAGATAVISTLWAVNDLSTALLMERFYQHYRQEGLVLPEALRQAQLWLRDVTAGELATRSPRGSSEYRHFSRDFKPEDRPFEHPFYWAAFTFSGV